MPGDSVAWETLLGGAHDRFTLDYVLVNPPEAFHGQAGAFPTKQWTAVLGQRPAVNVVSVGPITAQVVRAEIILDRTIRLGETLPEFALITSEGDSALDDLSCFLSPACKTGIQREYYLTRVERTGKGTVQDVEAAEENDASALEDPRIVDVARKVTTTAGDTLSAGARFAPAALVAGAALAGFLLVKG